MSKNSRDKKILIYFLIICGILSTFLLLIIEGLFFFLLLLTGPLLLFNMLLYICYDIYKEIITEDIEDEKDKYKKRKKFRNTCIYLTVILDIFAIIAVIMYYLLEYI